MTAGKPDRFVGLPDGTSVADLAARLGVTVAEVRRGLSRRPPRPVAYHPRRLDRDEIGRRYKSGESITEIAKAMGASRSGVWTAMVREGIPRRPRGAGSAGIFDGQLDAGRGSTGSGSRGKLRIVNAAQVLRLLADGSSRLSDAMRQALLLPSVPPGSGLASWIGDELRGYDFEPPDYRVVSLAVKGNAFNGVWLHRDNLLPLEGLPKDFRKYAKAPREIRQSVGELEDLLRAEGNGRTFAIPWPTDAVGRFNRAVFEGGTGMNQTYQVTEIWWEVSRGTVTGILERVRQKALSEVALSVPADERIAEAAGQLASSPLGPLTIQGSANQVVIGSPGTTAVLAIPPGDRTALDEALRSLGIGDAALAELTSILDETGSDSPTRVMRVLAWAKTSAASLGLGAAGSVIGTLVLQHLGHL